MAHRVLDNVNEIPRVSMNFKCKKDAGEHSYKTALGSGGLNVQIYQGKE